MASLIDTYASQAGVIPGDTPNINTQFFPLPFDRFVTLHTGNGAIDAKTYDYWAEAVNLLKPALHHFGIRIVQIGGPKDQIIQGCDTSYLTLTMAQSAYVQQQSLMHIGIDSFPMHRASAFGKKLVALFGHTYPEQVGLPWSKSEDIIILEPDRVENHPPFSAQEHPKMIDTIKAETICQSVFNLLGLPVSLNFETKFVGPLYNLPVIEVIPNFFGESAELKREAVHLRLDLHFNQNCAHTWAQHQPVRIITNQPVDLDLLRLNRRNIHQLTLLMSDVDTYSLEYIKEAKKLIPNLILVGTNDETLSDVRLIFFDWIVERMPPPDRSKYEQFIGCKFWSKKLVFSKAKQYASVAHFFAEKEFDKDNFILDSDETSREIDHFYVFQ